MAAEDILQSTLTHLDALHLYKNVEVGMNYILHELATCTCKQKDEGHVVIMPEESDPHRATRSVLFRLSKRLYNSMGSVMEMCGCSRALPE